MTDEASKLADRLEEVERRVLEGTFYEDYDYAAGEGLHALREAVTALRTHDALTEQVKALRTACVDTAAHLAAAISLLERGGKKAAPSDRMFEQMLVDYRASLDRARKALEATDD